MKKIVAPRLLALLLTLALCACTDAGLSRGTAVTTISGAAKPPLFEQTVFAVDLAADDAVFAAAQSFCRRVNSLSKSGLTLTASRSPSAIAELKSGKAYFAIINAETSAGLDSFFEITNESFRYKSYEHFSAVCNSAPVLSTLSQRLGYTVFAAYYTGSRYFISSEKLDDALIIAKSAEEEAPEPFVLTVPESTAEAALSFLGLTAREISSLQSRLTAAEAEATACEITLEEALELFSGDPWESSDEAVKYPELVFTRSFHSIEPLWLIMEPSFYDSLPPLERAAIDEAAAFMTADINNVFLSREREALDTLSDWNITLAESPALVHSRILRNRNRSLTGLSPDERDFRELLDSIM